MCGFAGLVAGNGSAKLGPVERILESMGDALQHRGPDGAGIWFKDNTGLVHRRLSIQDLSAAGSQPMNSASSRFVLAFNGEIYNFRHLRSELEKIGVVFKGYSDTEVMLAAFEAWGVESSLDRFNGMFAFALVDLTDRQLILARDRMGEKPLYYGWQKGALLFGSELKALQAHPSWEGEIDRSALTLLLRHNLIPAPHTIYQNIAKLPPASWVTFQLDGKSELWPDPKRYWSLEEAFRPSRIVSLVAAADELESRLTEVIGEQMIADVPLGAFLSGGIDSSTVVALMQKQVSQAVRTFTIGFQEKGFNEAEQARAVAGHLGTCHTELYVSPEDGLKVIPDLASIYDEPFADSSQIPTWLVSCMTRQHVTVALSGDGGDELFCGYPRYPDTVNAWNGRGSLKSRLRRLAAVMPPELMAQMIRLLVPGQRGRSVMTLAERLRQEGCLAKAHCLPEYYRRQVGFWAEPEALVKGGQELEYALTGEIPYNIADDPLKTLMWLDLNWYLPDDILVKVDRAAMACSLETRVPLLDRRIVEFALSLPTDLNMEAGIGKRVLREVLYRHVPREMVERPKQGFAVPLGQWLRTSLRDWAESLLDENRLKREGYFYPTPIRRLWKAHLAGVDDHAYALWGVLMFQAWLDIHKV
jgi:asparagine synthase (glutamine-hydrolysing)